MNPFQQSVEFWLIVLGAVLFKIGTSERLNFLGVIATVSGSILAAVVGTEVMVELLELKSASATYAVAAVLGLTGEDIMRRIIIKSRNGESPISIFRWLANTDNQKGSDK